MSVQELEMAVAYAYNPPGVGEEADRVKAQATRFCEEVKASKDGWRLALEVLRTTARPEARFFSLGCLQNALGARAGASVLVEAEHDRRMIREAIMEWLKTGSDAELKIQETFIRTKLAVVLALLVKVDYPEIWTDAFEHLQSLLMVSGGEGAGGSLSHVDLYLRVLCALDDEVVSFHVDRSKKEAEHNSIIKDTMRMSNAVVQMCGMIYEIVGAFRTEAPHVAALALETLGKFIGWIDITQVANERFLSLFTQCLRSSDENLVQRSCSCILEVVNKKMADPVSKLRLLQELKLTEMLKQVPLSDEAVAVRVTELVDGVIKQLLSVWDKLEPAAFDVSGDGGILAVSASLSLQPSDGASTLAATVIECSDMLEEAIPMLWACLSHPDVDVSSAALEAVGAVLNTLKKQLQAQRKGKGGLVGVGVGSGGVKAQAGIVMDSGKRFRAMDHLPQLLETLYRRMKYPPDFAFDPSDEDEGEEDMLRQQLRKHFVNAVRQAPEFVLDFLCHALSSLPTPLSTLPFSDLEAALRLIFHFGEGCGGMSWLNSGGVSGVGGRRGTGVGAGALELLRSGAFPQMVLALHESDVTQHKHPQVLMLYFQLTVRYSKLLVEAPAHILPKILGAICGPQGLSNPDVTLRTRSCYFLTKLVKAMRERIAPFVDVIVPGVEAMLDSRGNGLDLSDEAKLNLYETIGHLIGMPSIPVTAQMTHLDGVLGPPMKRIADTLAAQATMAHGADDNDALGSELATSVGAMANVSKGFKPELASEVEARFFQALGAATSALMAFPRHAALRAKIMFLIHGLILCLGEGLLRGLSLTTILLLVQEGDGKDLMEVTQLLNQLTIEYGPKSAQLLDGALLPFIRRTYQLMPGAGLSTAAMISDPSSRGPSNGTQCALEQASRSGFSGGWPAVSNVAQNVGFSPGGWGEAGPGAGGGPQLLPHEVAERSGVMKLYLSVIQHLSSNGLAGVLSSPTNSPYLGGVLRSVLGGIPGSEDAATKKTCLYIFSLLLGGFNRGRSGASLADRSPGSGSGATPGSNATAVKGASLTADGAGVLQRRGPAGKGGGLWQGTGATVDMEPPVRAGVIDFVLSEVVPAALRCLIDGTPAGLDIRDAIGLSAVVHMGGLFREALVTAGGSAGFVGAAAVGCNCTPQVAEQLQRAVETAVDGPAITTALKAFAEHMRPTR